MAVLKSLGVTVMYLAIVIGFIHYSPNLLDINPKPITVKLMKSFEGEFSPNERLSKAEFLFQGVVEGTESLALHKGIIYTGLRTGEIVSISGDKITKVAQIGQGDTKDGIWTEKKRGRPLGLRFTKQGKLLTADAYYGLHEVDIKTGEVKALLPTSQLVEGTRMKFPNDVTIDDVTGEVYMSDASTRWGLDDIGALVMEFEDSGRIIKYDPKTSASSVFASGLRFPNGVQITHDRQHLLVSEINGHVVWKYHLTGSKKGEREVFARLPGEPDNIRPSPRGGYWVALGSARNETTRTWGDMIADKPFVMRLLVRMFDAMGKFLDLLSGIYPSDSLKDFAYRIMKMEYILPLTANHCMIVELDASGQVVQTLQSSNTKMCFLSEVLEHDGYLYVGSFAHPYLLRLKL